MDEPFEPIREKFSRIYLANGQQYALSPEEGDAIRSQLHDPENPVVEFKAHSNKNEVFVTAMKAAIVAVISDIEDD
jgi:hypothetical protein